MTEKAPGGEKSCPCAVESEPDGACAADINEKGGSAPILEYTSIQEWPK
jgi:hypothetical protein